MMSVDAFIKFHLSSLIVLMLFISEPATARDEPERDALMACVERQMPGEKQKSQPKASTILAECQEELEALIKTLPADLQSDIRHFIEDDVSAELKRK